MLFGSVTFGRWLARFRIQEDPRDVNKQQTTLRTTDETPRSSVMTYSDTTPAEQGRESMISVFGHPFLALFPRNFWGAGRGAVDALSLSRE